MRPLFLQSAGQRVGSFLLGHESGHSIARPIACGNRVPPQRTVLRETTNLPPRKMHLSFRPHPVKMHLERSAERDKCEMKNNFSAEYGQSETAAILNRLATLDNAPLLVYTES